MSLVKRDYLYFILLFLISVIFISDIFFHFGKPQTFDATTHATTIAQYFLALQSGDFPVVWLGGFANYGLPIGIVAHQLTSYLGAVLTFITHDPLLSLYLVAFIGIFLSNLFFYLFLRLYVTPDIAFVSAFFFNFSSYRISNFYVRGAIPELFSQLFLPLMMLAIHIYVTKQKRWALALLTLTLAGLTLTHPMMLVIYSFVFIPYFLFLLFTQKNFASLTKKITMSVIVGIASVIGVGMASYYLIPLILENKYFYFGLSDNHLAANGFLSLQSFFDATSFQFLPSEIYTRGSVISIGILSTLVFLAAVVYLVFELFKKRINKETYLLSFLIVLAFGIALLTLPVSNIFYTTIKFMSGIQFPWRMLSSLIFIPPLLLGILLSKWQNKLVFLLIIVVVCLFSFPQLFGKDYHTVDKKDYYFSIYNSHSVMMNTIWTGNTEDYPIEKTKPGILEGKGSISVKKITNSAREYVIKAETPLRMVDHTFYFPGWKVLSDEKELPIEFQDPKFRGVITYSLDPGVHVVMLSFTPTKVRLVSEILSLLFLVAFVALLVLSNRIRLLTHL